MLNTELFIAVLGGMTAKDPGKLFMVAIAAGVGRMLGKTVLYYSVQKGLNVGIKPHSKLGAGLQKWHNKIEKMPHSRIYLLTLTGSATGLPPMYLLTLALGALKIDWKPHFFIGILGSTLKYAFFFGIGTELVKWIKQF